ncbi:MAG: DJ-1/PfpI family protein [Steroidobacteraceae bacterium]
MAIVGGNNGTQTETSDYLVPYGILKRADVADVVALATSEGPVKLYPALNVLPQDTVVRFDEYHPQGADYVIVPAMSRDNDPEVLRWLQQQAAKGAIIIGICAGAKVVAAAGLLENKRATTHWYYVKQLRERYPSIHYVADRRFVSDGRIVTTTGITASIPTMLTLIEAIAGRDKAASVARELGGESWDARHSSAAFAFTRPFALTLLMNKHASWRHEKLGIEIDNGVDEVSLALVTDAWSRTYRSRALTIGRSPGTIETRSGLKILPDFFSGEALPEQRLPAIGAAAPALALDAALTAIETRYGEATAKLVAMQLEYPRD